MPKFLSKELAITVNKLLKVSGEGRFVQLDDGRVLDLKITPYEFIGLNSINDTDKEPHLVSYQDQRFIVSRKFIEMVLYQPDPDPDLNDALALITNVEYADSGDTTICILHLGVRRRVVGVFTDVSLAEPDLELRREAAYKAAIADLVNQYINRNNERLEALHEGV